jgi:hypothetical protein
MLPKRSNGFGVIRITQRLDGHAERAGMNVLEARR